MCRLAPADAASTLVKWKRKKTLRSKNGDVLGAEQRMLLKSNTARIAVLPRNGRKFTTSSERMGLRLFAALFLRFQGERMWERASASYTKILIKNRDYQ